MGQYSGVFSMTQVAQAVKNRNWTNTPPPAVQYLVVAGGGGGGGAIGGGGGAGGLLQGNISVATGSALTVTVGSGGTGAAGGVDGQTGTNGSNSVFSSITSIGGGGGTAQNQNGSSGGSGGGANRSATLYSAGSGVFGQGNDGGRGGGNDNSGGGGGGAGTVGLKGVNYNAGNGGAGVASDISGTRTAYAGGGGAGARTDASASGGTGGAGGGGNGKSTSVAGDNGTANTGGGGGSGGFSGTFPAGGAGGSGIVIISYPDTYAAAASTTGSPTVSTSGSGSISFNGSSYFNYNGQSAFAFGSSNFTIEFWFNCSSFTSGPVIYDSRPGGTNGAYVLIYLDTSGIPYLYVNSANQITGSALSTNTWYHLALSRSSTSTKLFINGSQVGSTYTDSTSYLNGAARPVIGTNGISIGASSLSGYISNMRVVNGTALYTSNFTPSVIPLTAVTNTQLLLNSVSGSYLIDGSTNAYNPTTVGGSPVWNSSSPFVTGLGYKNRVYTWTSSGSITF